MKKRELIVISLGGSMIINGGGVHLSFLQKFKKIMEEETARGLRFVIIAGGGNTARMYQTAGRVFAFTDRELDLLGIRACRMNGELMTHILKKVKGVKVAVGGRPGQSSDGIATRLAIKLGARRVINISSEGYVYDADPQNNPRARRITQLTWKEYRTIVGSSWVPGMHAPFDPTAARLADTSKLTVSFMSGDRLADLSRILQGQAWQGSCISP